MRPNKGILSALAAAVLFGASTPIAKTLVGDIPPVLAGRAAVRRLRPGARSWACCFVALREVAGRRRRLHGHAVQARLAGGGHPFRRVCLGPVLLMFGLVSTPAIGQCAANKPGGGVHRTPGVVRLPRKLRSPHCGRHGAGRSRRPRAFLDARGDLALAPGGSLIAASCPVLGDRQQPDPEGLRQRRDGQRMHQGAGRWRGERRCRCDSRPSAPPLSAVSWDRGDGQARRLRRQPCPVWDARPSRPRCIGAHRRLLLGCAVFWRRAGSRCATRSAERSVDRRRGIDGIGRLAAPCPRVRTFAPARALRAFAFPPARRAPSSSARPGLGRHRAAHAPAHQ